MSTAMLKPAGIAQLREHRLTRTKVAGASPAPRSIAIGMAKAFAEGLAQDPDSRDLGRADGLAGLPYRRDGAPDMFAYGCGYVEGEVASRLQARRGGR